MKLLFRLITIAAMLFYVNAAYEDNPQPGLPCTTPNNESAYCISLFSCPVLIKSTGSSDPSTIDFVKKSSCGDGKEKDIKVCCGTSGNFLGPTNTTSTAGTTPPQVTVESQRDFVIRKLLTPYCGFQHTDDIFYNKSETALDEFPWLVHVKNRNVEDDSDVDERCNGVLISKQYVLTDYYCGFDARKVKLGQYATSENFSCIEDLYYPGCTEPTLVVDVVEKYRWKVPPRSGDYNLVLMRLAKKISYTDYIRPICLPVDDSVRTQKQDVLTFSGWGASDSKKITKKRLIYDVTDVDKCYKVDEYLEGNIKSAKVDLVCLAVKNNYTNQACNGDHGGPLMFSHGVVPQWFAYGIVIQVFPDQPSEACSNNHPVKGIAITSEIIEWILSKMHD